MKYVLATILLLIGAAVSFGQEQKKFKDDSEVPRVTIEEAKKLYDSGSAVFVDARGTDAYKDERIKGAISIPAGSSEKEYKKLPAGKTIITYCS